jgi:hypothetical protein
MNAFDTAFANGIIDIYSGSQPATADAAETGTKLARITLASGAFTPGVGTNGLNFDTAADGSIAIDSGEVWSGVGLAAGTAGWFRFYANDVVSGASTVAVRFDGVCGVGTGELRLSSLTVAVGATISVDSATITQPASA